MFFFIGGVQPRTVVLDGTPRSCPNCGRVELLLQRTDHVLSLFFIPLFPLKKGLPARACGSCGAVYDEEGARRLDGGMGPEAGGRCPSCGRPVAPDFRFCPYCSAPLK